MPMTPCPACGAPLEYTGDGETVRCNFCGAEFQVTEVDGRPRFDVVGQPSPQKEVLQDQVSQIVDTPEDAPQPANTAAGGASIYPNEPDMYQQAFQADLNAPQAPEAQTVHTGEASRWSGVETLPPPPPPVSTAPSSVIDSVRKPGTPGRWIAIAVAVILVLCMSCACIGFLAMMAQRGGSFQ